MERKTYKMKENVYSIIKKKIKKGPVSDVKILRKQQDKFDKKKIKEIKLMKE